MNIIQRNHTFETSSESFLEPEMANLMEMTTDVVMKIKQQTKEIPL